MNKFKIDIASVPDRNNLVAEIWYEEHLLAEINQEEKTLNVEFYNVEKVTFQYEDFINTLQDAKRKLLEQM